MSYSLKKISGFPSDNPSPITLKVWKKPKYQLHMCYKWLLCASQQCSFTVSYTWFMLGIQKMPFFIFGSYTISWIHFFPSGSFTNFSAASLFCDFVFQSSLLRFTILHDSENVFSSFADERHVKKNNRWRMRRACFSKTKYQKIELYFPLNRTHEFFLYLYLYLKTL